MKLAAIMRTLIACKGSFRAVDISAVEKTIVLVSASPPIDAAREAKRICARVKRLFPSAEVDHAPTATGAGILIAIAY